MKTLNVVLIGFGAVGQGFLQVLQAQAPMLADQFGARVLIVGVATRAHGSLFRLDGLDIEGLIEAGQRGGMGHYPEQPRLIRGLNSMAILTRPGVDVVVEVSHTNLETGEPAISHVRAALAAGKHVITANKGPIALAYADLAAQAEHRNVFLGYEGTVMGGTPALRITRTALAGCTIREVRGILNGTTNYILTRMEEGKPYEAALSEAQLLGYAEADPTGDVDGYDAASKLVILSNIVLGGALRLGEVARQGITMLTLSDIEAAKASGERWKLMAHAQRADDGRVIASVRPERLPLSDPLASVGGVMNAITYQTDLLGPVTLIGAGAGGRETGYAILSDIIELAQRD